MIIFIWGLFAAVSAASSSDKKDSYKDQYCTDPRTMRKHAAYTEWADAYSCTRHRCQPGGRNLAIYTVGCKRVEAPESAIECEEVVEDTNMQFPFCCTRLRCLVVVRGEVWTRVLGQPWEVLPAAPWSHMYKMKKPPPSDTTFLPKTTDQGPIYELAEPENDGNGHQKVLRSGKKTNPDGTDCNDVNPRAAPTPDIVIALSTNNEVKEHKKTESEKQREARRTETKVETSRHKRARKTTRSPSQYFDEDRTRERDRHIDPEILELDDLPMSTEKPTNRREHPQVAPPHSGLQLVYPVDPPQMDRQSEKASRERQDADTLSEGSDEKFYANNGVTQKPVSKSTHHQVGWTEIPQNQWNEHEGMDLENRVNEPTYQQPEFQAQEAPEPKPIVAILNKGEKSTNLQALVDAIGTRMRDIESVVQRMSEKVHQTKPGEETGGAGGTSGEKRPSAEQEVVHKHHKSEAKRASTEPENYKRFTMHNRGSQYLHSTTDITTELPLFIEDNNMKGYFSDASNSVLRRNSPPKEPPPIYMAPVETNRQTPAHIAVVSDSSDDAEKKKKKRTHKKKRNKNHSHKKHHSKDDKRKHYNKPNSIELDKNVVSLEDNSAIAN